MKIDPNHYENSELILSSSDYQPKVQWLSHDRLAIDTAGGEVFWERPYVWDYQLTIVFSNAPWPTKWTDR